MTHKAEQTLQRCCEKSWILNIRLQRSSSSFRVNSWSCAAIFKIMCAVASQHLSKRHSTESLSNRFTFYTRTTDKWRAHCHSNLCGITSSQYRRRAPVFGSIHGSKWVHSNPQSIHGRHRRSLSTKSFQSLLFMFKSDHPPLEIPLGEARISFHMLTRIHFARLPLASLPK